MPVSIWSYHDADMENAGFPIRLSMVATHITLEKILLGAGMITEHTEDHGSAGPSTVVSWR